MSEPSADPLKEKLLHPLAQLERDFLQVARDLNGGEYATLITHSLLPIAHRIVEAALAAYSAAPSEREATVLVVETHKLTDAAHRTLKCKLGCSRLTYSGCAMVRGRSCDCECHRVWATFDEMCHVAALSQDKPTLRYVWHGTNDSREGSTGRVYTDPLMQKAYDEGFEHGASQDKPTRAGAGETKS